MLAASNQTSDLLAQREAAHERARVSKRKWVANNRDYIRERARQQRARGELDHTTRRWRVLGVCAAEFAKKFQSQGSKCAVCGAREAKKWSLDHDHHTLRVRAVLCNRCNLGLGLFGDSAVRLRAAADYIELHGLL